MIDYFFRLLLKNPKQVLASVLLVTLFWSSFIPNLKIDFSIEHLFSKKEAVQKI